MTSLSDQTVFLRLEPLTPVHVGAGHTMDPLSYVMRDNAGQPCLYHVDVSAWIEDHPDPAELADFFGSRSLPEIRARVAEELDPEHYGLAPVRVLSREIYTKYTAELGATRSQNQLLIDSALCNPLTGALIVPGSSIKGAIRTAVIDWLDQKWKLGLKAANSGGRYDAVLKDCLGPIGDNAFKNLKVGDFHARLGASCIVAAKELRKTPSESPSTPKNPCEATLSRVSGDQPLALYGKLQLGRHDAARRDTVLTVAETGQDRRRKSWNLSELMGLCTAFYKERYQNETKNFYELPHFAPTAKALERLTDCIPPGEGAMLLRVGHYSHVECVTVTANDPKTPSRRGLKMPWGKTRTLADGVYPFGWCRLSLCSAAEYQEAERSRAQHDADLLQARDARRTVLSAQRAQQARARAEAERAREEARLAEERERERLERLSPEERLILRVREPKAIENHAVELFNILDSLDPALKRQAAEAIKDFWVRANKWEKKKCTDKQWKKVQRVRSLLGEA